MWMDSAGVLYSFTATDTLVTNDAIYSRKIGNKRYELTDHLGNVRVAVSDILLNHSGSPDAEVVSYTDYHPFGMAMTGRSSAADGYRYGFNGKENDNEVKGTGNQQDYGFRIYDPRLARFMSVDPLASDYPSWSPYPFAMDRPIDGVDLDGLEWESTVKAANEQFGREISKWKSGAELFWKRTKETMWTVVSFTDVNDATVLATTLTRGDKAVNVDGTPAD